KKPSPVIARSRSLPVCDSVPWVIERGVPTVLTPPPISMPTGRMVPWSEDCAQAADVLVDQILKRGGLFLVAGGAKVGDVVGDDLDVEFLGRHSGRSSVKRLHGCSPKMALCRDV